MDLLGRFVEAGSPGRAYRPLVLWTWNDRLEADEVRRQVREMARGGLGGHVMAAGRGLGVPYLGPAWMDAVRAAIDEGGHTGVAAWLCDEAAGPCGWGGGRVCAGREAFRQQYLVLEEVSGPGWEPTEATVAVYVAEREGRDAYRAFRRVDQPRALCGKTPGPQEAFLHFFRRPGEHPDPLSREATEEFLKQTHHRYRETVGGEFGRGVPGVLTRGSHCAGGGHRVPWSPHLVRYFRRSCDYDLLDHLPELFYPVGPYRKTRFDFYETLTRLFLLAWTMPVYQWCDRHGLRLAGHLGGADTLLEQVRRVGAAMPHYEYMHVPGVAWPGLEPGRASAVREAASVAAQFGRRRVLAEAFEAAGWGLSLDRMRFLAEWQLALGVNFLCAHHAAYSLRGERKRDRPPSLHYHQPWWPAYHQWNAYLTGLAAALAAGEERVGVLVLHPVAGAWAEYSPLDPGPVEALQEALDRLVGFLLAAHVPFHFGDELVLERQASVSKGELRVGPCRYHTVVVPETPNLRRSTVALLGRLKRSGGRIVLAGRVPDHVDGEPSAAPARLAEGCLRADPATARGRTALRRALGTGLAVLGPGGRDAAEVLAQWREVDGGHLFYFLHTGESQALRCRIRLPVEGTPRLLDTATGEARSVRSAKVKGGRTLAHTFPPRGSLLVWVPARAEGEEAAQRPGARYGPVADRGGALLGADVHPGHRADAHPPRPPAADHPAHGVPVRDGRLGGSAVCARP